jgi:ribosome-binding protein aMBF1 (putative translation factor)
MSFQMPTNVRGRKVARFIERVHQAIQTAFVDSGMSQNQLAKKLGVDRSIVNRRLLGHDNLTLKTVAELAWALDHDVVFEFRPADHIDREDNHYVLTDDDAISASVPSITSRSRPHVFRYQDAEDCPVPEYAG